MSDRRCRGTKPDGSPCMGTIVGDRGWCPAHDPDRAEARKRASARANERGRDPELREVRAGLRSLTEQADRPGAAHDRIDVLVRIARARVYAIKADAEIARGAAEIEELEDAYDRLLSDYEALRDGKAAEPSGWYLRKELEGA